jgi:ribulose-phosphate 3-epimerase
MEKEVIPAILSYTREDLFDKIRRTRPFVKTAQIDIMDGAFVNNSTISIKHLRGLPEGVAYEMHWMVEQPERWISKVDDGYHHIVHYQTIRSFDSVIDAVKEAKGSLGIALNPVVQAEDALDYIKKASSVLVMTVEPGYSGQKYMPQMEDKIRSLRKKFPKIDIEVDGGIDRKTALRAARAGANKVAAASSIFKPIDTGKAVRELMESVTEGCKQWEKKSSG